MPGSWEALGKKIPTGMFLFFAFQHPGLPAARSAMPPSGAKHPNTIYRIFVDKDHYILY
jgi:hypothetical protein